MIKTVKLDIPEETTCILGQTHSIKSIEDLYEALADSAPALKFGIAFCEASGPCLIRTERNDDSILVLERHQIFYALFLSFLRSLLFF